MPPGFPRGYGRLAARPFRGAIERAEPARRGDHGRAEALPTNESLSPRSSRGKAQLQWNAMKCEHSIASRAVAEPVTSSQTIALRFIDA